MSEPDLSSPDAAERAFYLAFEALDLALMGQVWLDDDSIRCIHPGGDLLAGRSTVLGSWRGILTASRHPQVRFRLLERVQHGDLALHLVEERIAPDAAASEDHGTRILATNVYRRTAAGWRLMLHHASLPLSAPQRDTGAPNESSRLH